MKRVKAAHFASLIIDGATGASIMEQDIVYVRTCQAGVIDVDIIGLETTPKSGKTNLNLKRLLKCIIVILLSVSKYFALCFFHFRFILHRQWI